MSAENTESVIPPAPPDSGEGRRASAEDAEEDPLVIDEENEKTTNTNEEETATVDEENEKEFEPTVDMLMNEFDDEQTIEEEEALAEDDEG